MKEKDYAYSPKRHFWRNGVCMSVILWAARLIVRTEDYQYEPFHPREKTFLLVANHNDKLDPIYEMVHLGRYIRYVASDHVVRSGIFGKLINFFATPIVKHRDRPSSELVQNIQDTLKNGVCVGLHAEGGMSVNGESRYISPNTGKLIKDADCDVITYRMVGGYLRSPRWAVKKRKGPLRGGVVHTYTREELRQMTEEEIYQAVCRDLYVNAYEEQRKNPQRYVGENLAENCETVLYECPKCHGVATLRSMGNFLFCDCGYKVELQEDGFFHDCGAGLIYDNIRDWDHWQKMAIRSYIDGFSRNFTDPIFMDDRQIVRQVEGNEKKQVSETGTVALYYDRLEIHWPGTDLVYAIGDVEKLDYVSRQSLLIVTADCYLDLESAYPRSPQKYIEAWRYLTHRPSY